MHSFTNSKDAARNLIAKDKKLKEKVFGTIVYVPPQPIVDFGKETWPAIHEKQKVCPRMLLVANWTDGRFFLVGGGVDKNESQLEAMNREFEEEMGCPGNFTEEDYRFSLKETEQQVMHIYGKTTSSLDFFNSVLQAFHQNCDRKAYMEEVVAVGSIPLWIEGPASKADFKPWGNGIFGLPAMLGTGGTFKVNGKNNRSREILIILLHSLSVIDTALVIRTLHLAELFTSEETAESEGPNAHICTKLSTYDELIAIPGVADVMGLRSAKCSAEEIAKSPLPSPEK